MFSSAAGNGNLYYSSNYENNTGGFDIYRSQLIDGEYSKPENLGKNINSSFNEFHAYIAIDETYIILDSDRDGGFGNNDLYISFRKSGGGWTEAANMGDKINTEYSDMRPFVSPDGKYLFFCSNRIKSAETEDIWQYDNFMKRINGPGNSSQDIYWVSAQIIEDLKPENIK